MAPSPRSPKRKAKKAKGPKEKMMPGHARCMKCKANRKMVDAHVEEMAKRPGTYIAKGRCAECGTKMARLLGKKKTF